MRLRTAGCITVWGLALAISPSISAQSARPAEPAKAAAGASARDLSGVWVLKAGQTSGLLTGPGQEPPMTAWGKAQFRAAKSAGQSKQADTAASDPHKYCDPTGVPRVDSTQKPIEIVESSDEMYIFYEEDHGWRQIYMDGRALPEEPDSSYLGYSVGKWEGDTLVVDTVGLNEMTWLDGAGHPHSDALRVEERFRREGPDALRLSITITDPKAYAKTWTAAPRIFERKAGYELTEDYCVPPENVGTRRAPSSPAPAGK
jgi:hypothetical protein